MALVAFPLQSNFMGFDEYGNPLFDRAVDALFIRKTRMKDWTDGIYFEPADNFKVSAADGMHISIKLGECHIQGLTVQPDENVTELIKLDAAETAIDRTDRIVLRADFEDNRIVTIEVRKSWKHSDSLTRNSNYWELAIADVYIPKGTLAVHGANITDLRLNSELCGIVTEPIKRTNTQAFFEQLQLELQRIKGEWSAQKAQQADDWQTQTEQQQSTWQEAFDARVNEIDGFYSAIRNDITKLQTYDFDNIAALSKVTKTTTRVGDVITETILNTITGVKVAERITTRESVGGMLSISEVMRLFAQDGVSVFKSSTIVTTRDSNGVITETVTGYDDYSLLAAYISGNKDDGLIVTVV